MHCNRILALLLAFLALTAALSACAQAAKDTETRTPTVTVTYTEDTELGTGKKTATVLVTADGTTRTFKVHTDEDTVGDALLALGLIAGENGAYGLYIKVVNGILADWGTDGTYWSFYQNGEMAMGGVDATPFADGETYEFRKE